jgi:tRNA(Ile)-lysidine synthase
LFDLPTMFLITTVRRTIQRFGLIEAGARVMVALSGGADSVALLQVLRELTEQADGHIAPFKLAGIAHLNHLLRGAQADGDEAFCRDLAEKASLPCDVERVDVGRIARETGVSLEQAAHDERYAFFDRAAARLNADLIAVAHTRDDQAETFLLRLLRGAGPRGLGGMHPRTGRVIRPFLDVGRDEVRNFLRDRHVQYREDASNADLDIPRNRIRHELLPLLESRFSPGIVEVLAREAAIARDDAQYLDAAATAAAARVLVAAPDRVELSIPALLAEPPAIAARVVRHAQQLASGGKFAGFDAVEAVLALAVSNSTGPLDLPGHRVNRLQETLVLTRRPGRTSPELPESTFSYGLDVPGTVSVPEAACAISAEAHNVPPGESASARWPLMGRGDQVVVEAGRLSRPLVVRSRRPGDAFRPLGLHGRKKLQDFFVDAKIQRGIRDKVPLVVDAEGRIVWVAGLAVSEEFRVTDHTRAVVILKRVPA